MTSEDLLFSISTQDLWTEEKRLFQQGYKKVAGIDEAGRGPLAGPVVAATVLSTKKIALKGVNDSKMLSPSDRIKLRKKLLRNPHLKIGIGQASVEEIDQLNILQASFLAFRRSIEAIEEKPDFCLIDGNLICPDLNILQKPMVKGDSRSFLIAAASIIAKVTRDDMMEQYDKQYPQYGFSAHKGYGTKKHLEAIRTHGICEIHRKSFDPIKSYNHQLSSNQKIDELLLFEQ